MSGNIFFLSLIFRHSRFSFQKKGNPSYKMISKNDGMISKKKEIKIYFFVAFYGKDDDIHFIKSYMFCPRRGLLVCCAWNEIKVSIFFIKDDSSWENLSFLPRSRLRMALRSRLAIKPSKSIEQAFIFTNWCLCLFISTQLR